MKFVIGLCVGFKHVATKDIIQITRPLCVLSLPAATALFSAHKHCICFERFCNYYLLNLLMLWFRVLLLWSFSGLIAIARCCFCCCYVSFRFSIQNHVFFSHFDNGFVSLTLEKRSHAW